MATTTMDVRPEREEKRGAFHLKYALGEGETGVDFCNILSKFVSGRYGFFGLIEEMNGVWTAEAVLSIPSRFRITAFSQRSRWKRAGAQGSLVDLQWPSKGQSARKFLEKWAREVSSQPPSRQFGSERDLFLELDRYQDRDADRKKIENMDGDRMVAWRPPKKLRRNAVRRRYDGSRMETVVVSEPVGVDHHSLPPVAEEAVLSQDPPVLVEEDAGGIDFLSFLDVLEVPELEEDCFVDFCCDDVLFPEVNFDLDAMLEEQGVCDIFL